MSEFVAKCKQCGILERGDREAVGDAIEEHDQFHSTNIVRAATDGGVDPLDVERLYYATSRAGTNRALHAETNCQHLKQASNVTDASASNPPTGTLCDECFGGLTLDDLLQQRQVAADGGHPPGAGGGATHPTPEREGYAQEGEDATEP